MRSIYIIGSLRNPDIRDIGNRLREAGHDAFDDWHAAGPEADDSWRDYEKGRGHSLPEALEGWAARHVFEFDKKHLNRCDTGLLIYPAGKSGHLELGYMAGLGKDCAILLQDEPDRFDVMMQFANLGVFYNLEDFISELSPAASLRGDSGVFPSESAVLDYLAGRPESANVSRLLSG